MGCWAQIQISGSARIDDLDVVPSVATNDARFRTSLDSNSSQHSLFSIQVQIIEYERLLSK